MSLSDHWARAFINSLEKAGGEIEDGIEILKVLSDWVKKLPQNIYGSTDAKKAEILLRDGMAKFQAPSLSLEIAIRLLALMVKKNKIRRIDSVIVETEKLLHKKRGILVAFIEYAFPIDEATESRIKEEIKKLTGALTVDLKGRIVPELIGGYRLLIGDRIIDASVGSQLKKLETCLAGGN